MNTHLAAMLPAQGAPFEVASRPTPRAGRGELLIAVKSVALNPADHIMRDTGLFIPSYPTVIGFDVSGLVLEVGDDVPVNEGQGPAFKPGVTRVAAYVAAAWKGCDPDYGAFQEKCLVPWQHAVPLPEKGMSWDEAATLPVAVQVALSAWDALGVPRMGHTTGDHIDEDQKVRPKKDEAILIWGASSSLGTMGVQSGRLLVQDPSNAFAAVYATASLDNHDYVSSLGADRVFDYKDPRIVENVLSTAREDGLAIRHCFLAIGQLPLCQDILKSFVVNGSQDQVKKAKIASAPAVPANSDEVAGVETIWVMPSNDEQARLRQFQYWLGTWLTQRLATKEIRPSPKSEVVGEGLEFVNHGLNELSKGVSCTKLVVKVAE